MSKNPYANLDLKGVIAQTNKGDYIQMVLVSENGKQYLLAPPYASRKRSTHVVLGEGCDFGPLVYCMSLESATTVSAKLKGGFSHVQILELEELELYF
jgi:hypothetical protein